MRAQSLALRPVAALCVSGRSLYKHTAGVLAYDRNRDAKTFPGGMPVVAHPPCRHWSKSLGHMAKAKDPAAEMALGLWCVEQVKKCGGILEHPAHSRLWEAARLPGPGDLADPFCYTVYIEQGWFGLPCRKPTWVLVCGVPPDDLPMIPFRLQDRRGGFASMNQQERARTMPALVQWLLTVARATWHSLPIQRTGELARSKMPNCSSCEIGARANAIALA